MGGCASKPKDSQVESLDESPINPKEIPISIDGNPPVEVSAALLSLRLIGFVFSFLLFCSFKS